jgi:oxygen-dependent protoporphyrinogen oxidase
VRDAAPVAADLLDQVDYASVALVTVAARRRDVGHPLDGSGVLLPVRGRGLLTACSFGSSKWPAWAGDGDRVVLRLSAGRHRDQRALDLDDDAIVDVLIGEVAPLLDWSGDVLEWRVTRWVDAFPQYAVGHRARLEALERHLARSLPAVHLAGAGYRGLGIPACIQQGQEAARRLLGGSVPA